MGSITNWKNVGPGARGVAAPSGRQTITLSLTDNGDGSVQLDWTDSVTRVSGVYGIFENGVKIDEVDFDQLSAELSITDLREDSRWQIKYGSSAFSNRVTLTGLVNLAESWRDYDNAVTFPGRRLTAASSQYLEMAHAADLNLTTAGTILIWCKKAQSLNQSNCVFLTKGQQSVNIVYGLYGGNYTNLGGDTLSFKTASTSTDQSAEAGDYLGAHAWSFAPSSAVAYRNGSAVTVANTPPSALTTNSQPVRIGGDGGTGTTWKYFDGWLFCVAIWNRTLSNADIAALTAGTTPPTYETLGDVISGGTTGLVRWFDLGESLTCKVSEVTLTENGGSTTVQDQILSVVDRSNGLTYTAPTGRWPTKSTGVFGTAVSAFHDALANEAGTVGMSRCTLRATLDQGNLPFTQPTGRMLSAARYTTSLHTTENFHDAIDSGAAQQYILDGYMKQSGTYWFALRYNNGGLGVSSGNWRGTLTPALNTNYKVEWAHNGNAFIHKVNNAYDTVTVNFSGTAPSWVDEIDTQQFAGTSLSGGGSALGHYGPCVKFNGYPSTSVNGRADAWYASKCGFTQAESDVTGEAFATAVEATGYTYAGDDRQNDIDLFRSMRRDGILHLIKSMFLFGFSSANANKIDWIDRTVGAFGGTVTQGTGKVTMGSGGYLDPQRNITQIGLSGADNCGLFVIQASNFPTSTFLDLAMTNAGSQLFEMTNNYTLSGRLSIWRFGGFDANTALSADTTSISNVTGIWQMSRLGANGFAALNNYTTDTNLASSGSMTGGTLPNLKPVLGGMNTNGSLSNFSQRDWRGYGTTAGMTSAQGLLFRANIKAWLQARGFI